MSTLLALDVAILPPPDISGRAVALSSALPDSESQGLRLGPDALPHITLTQQFVERDAIDAVLARIDEVLRRQPPLPLRVSGGGRSGATVWMTIERSQALSALHESLMTALAGFETPHGTAEAFAGGAARPGDLVWVAGYRRSSSFGSFSPHITLGHAAAAPACEPLTFDATTVAACHLGRFCTCRRVLRRWTLER